MKDFAKAQPSEVEPYIKSIGLYRNKAKNVVLAAQKLITDFAGIAPRTREELETLPGVGKKPRPLSSPMPLARLPLPWIPTLRA